MKNKNVKKTTISTHISKQYAECNIRQVMDAGFCKHGLLSKIRTLPQAPCRPNAQHTCSRTSAEESPARARRAATPSGLRGAFPSATAILRNQRSWPIRRMGLPAIRWRNSASLQAKRLTREAQSRPLRTVKSFSVLCGVWRFHGQTSWQSSHP